MQRFHQILFSVSLVALCWYAMMAVHEMGHVIGAAVSGGKVVRVVLYPLAISRTDVSPDPHPALVLWSGPIVGCLAPLALVAVVPQRRVRLRNTAWFFAGFCAIANGAYISIGSVGQVGDCGEMLRTGTPRWVMFAFGALTVPFGLFLWHRLGSFAKFTRNPAGVTRQMAYWALAALFAMVAVQFTFSPR
jgi:hypothetical protein